MARFHPMMTKDAYFLLNLFAPSEEKISERAEVLNKLNAALVPVRNGLRIEDISMRRYAADLDIAPLHLVVVDTDYPKGVSPEDANSTLPEIYHPSHTASLLQQRGFNGVFHSPEASRRTAVGAKRSPRDPPPKVDDTDIPWPNYPNMKKRDLLYPATLTGQTPVQFDLTLPGPTMRPLIDMLSCYASMAKYIPETIGLLYIWLRSWGTMDMSPVVLSTLFINFLQEKLGVPTLQLPADQEPGGSSAEPVWVPYRSQAKKRAPTRVVPVLLDVSYQRQRNNTLIDRTLGPVLYNFLEWFVEQKFSGGGQQPVISIHRPSCPDPEHGDEIDALAMSPPSWTSHQLVVRDPFVPTYNHASHVSRQSLNHLSVIANHAVNALRRGGPLSSVFGPYVVPPRASAWFSRQTSPFSDPRAFASFGFQARSFHADIRVGQAMTEHYRDTVPSSTHHSLRASTVQAVQSAIQSQYGQQYSVQLFGSTRYGVDSPSSDLDMVVVDPDRMDGFSPNIDLKSLPEIYNVRDLATTLRRNGFHILRVIPQASVPIVKFMHPRTSLLCDINVNDQLGAINTALIKHYCDLNPIMRPLLLTIKRWAKPLGLNNPGAENEPSSFSSYALTLMTIGLLQMHGMLPNLQDMSGAGRPEAVDFFWLRRKGQSLRCDTRWRKMENWRPPQQPELEEVLRRWFYYWSNEHNYETDVLSIWHAGLVPRERIHVKYTGGLSGIVPFSGETPEPPPADEDDEPQDKIGKKKAKQQDDQVTKASTSKASGQMTEASKDEIDSEADDALAEVESMAGSADAASDSSSEAHDGRQPSVWAMQLLCVADPFIRTKNVTASVGVAMVRRFKEECQRAYMILSTGGSLDDLLTPDLNLDPPRRYEPNSARGRRRGRGRGRGGEGGLARTDHEKGQGRRSTDGRNRRGNHGGASGRDSEQQPEVILRNGVAVVMRGAGRSRPQSPGSPAPSDRRPPVGRSGRASPATSAGNHSLNDKAKAGGKGKGKDKGKGKSSA